MSASNDYTSTNIDESTSSSNHIPTTTTTDYNKSGFGHLLSTSSSSLLQQISSTCSDLDSKSPVGSIFLCLNVIAEYFQKKYNMISDDLSLTTDYSDESLIQGLMTFETDIGDVKTHKTVRILLLIFLAAIYEACAFTPLDKKINDRIKNTVNNE
jgi:hypothetical protein